MAKMYIGKQAHKHVYAEERPEMLFTCKYIEEGETFNTGYVAYETHGNYMLYATWYNNTTSNEANYVHTSTSKAVCMLKFALLYVAAILHGGLSYETFKRLGLLWF